MAPRDGRNGNFHGGYCGARHPVRNCDNRFLVGLRMQVLSLVSSTALFTSAPVSRVSSSAYWFQLAKQRLKQGTGHSGRCSYSHLQFLALCLRSRSGTRFRMARRRSPTPCRHQNPHRANGIHASPSLSRRLSIINLYCGGLHLGDLSAPSCQIYIRACKYLVRALPFGPRADGNQNNEVKACCNRYTSHR